MKKTRWFRGAQKPTFSGVYERMFRDETVTWFSYYSSRTGCWSWTCKSVDEAHKLRRNWSYAQSVPWRGLAEKPKC